MIHRLFCSNRLYIFFVPFVRKRRREIKFENEYYYTIIFVSYPISYLLKTINAEWKMALSKFFRIVK